MSNAPDGYVTRDEADHVIAQAKASALAAIDALERAALAFNPPPADAARIREHFEAARREIRATRMSWQPLAH